MEAQTKCDSWHLFCTIQYKAELEGAANALANLMGRAADEILTNAGWKVLK